MYWLVLESHCNFAVCDQFCHLFDFRRNKDSGVVRATVVNFLLMLGTTQREHLNKYLCNFVFALLEKDQELSPVRRSYIINSLIHRQKQRAWQTALVLISFIQEVCKLLFNSIIIELKPLLLRIFQYQMSSFQAHH